MLTHDAHPRDGEATARSDSTSAQHEEATTPEEEVAVAVAPTVLDVSRYRHLTTLLLRH